MKTIISGPVKQHHLDEADMLYGISPSVYITNGDSVPPFGTTPVDVQPPCPMLPGELGEHQRDWTMCLQADALILVGENPHLLHAATRNKLLVYVSDR